MITTIKGFKAGEPYRVIKPIPVSFRKLKADGPGWVAFFKAANIGTQANTRRQVVADLRSLLLENFDDLSKAKPQKLGQAMRRYRKILHEHIQRKR